MKRLPIVLSAIAISVLALVAALRMVPSAGGIHASGGIHAVLICGSCVFNEENPSMKDAGALILDEDSGNLWFYKGDSIIGGKNPPVLMGHMSELGKPVIPAQKP